MSCEEEEGTQIRRRPRVMRKKNYKLEEKCKIIKV